MQTPASTRRWSRVSRSRRGDAEVRPEWLRMRWRVGTTHMPFLAIQLRSRAGPRAPLEPRPLTRSTTPPHEQSRRATACGRGGSPRTGGRSAPGVLRRRDASPYLGLEDSRPRRNAPVGVRLCRGGGGGGAGAPGLRRPRPTVAGRSPVAGSVAIHATSKDASISVEPVHERRIDAHRLEQHGAISGRFVRASRHAQRRAGCRLPTRPRQARDSSPNPRTARLRGQHERRHTAPRVLRGT